MGDPLDDLNQAYQQLTAGGAPFGFTLDLADDALDVLPRGEPEARFQGKTFGQSEVSFRVSLRSPKMSAFKASAVLKILSIKPGAKDPERTLYFDSKPLGATEVGVGDYEFSWDGFGNNGAHDGILRTEDFWERSLVVSLTLSEEGGATRERRLRLNASNASGELIGGGDVDFLDLEVNRNEKTVKVWVYLNFKLGETKEPLAGGGETDWGPHMLEKAKQGISKRWSRTIRLDGEDYKVSTRCLRYAKSSQTFLVNVWLLNRSKQLHEDIPEVKKHLPQGVVDFVEKYDPTRFGASNRFPYLDGELYFWVQESEPDRSEDYSATAAHEFGHTVLYYAEGLDLSITHKGTSNYRQQPEPDAPTVPAAPEEIDLMYYYAGSRPSDYSARRRACEEDVKRLISLVRIELEEA